MIFYRDRETGETKEEQVFGAKALKWVYGDSLFASLLCPLISRSPLFSHLYGTIQKMGWTKRKIKKFVTKYGVKEEEFETHSFASFNDFFIRKLKREARPIDSTLNGACIPADGRYQLFSKIGEVEKLKSLIPDPHFQDWSVMLARLAPVDMHRFAFPCGGVPGKSEQIEGPLYSVNPLATRKNPWIYTQNRRTLTLFETPLFGKVLLLEVGATSVGTIHQTYQPGKSVEKGEEKGYFSFGGSALIHLFPPGSILFSEDLLKNTRDGFETLCKQGQHLGMAKKK